VPRIFDNMDLTLVSALRENLPAAHRVDVSVGYFNLRGFRTLPGQEQQPQLAVVVSTLLIAALFNP
jgi:hypothetical protein